MNKIYKANDWNSNHIWEEDGKFFLGWCYDESTARKEGRIFEGKEEIPEEKFWALKKEWEAEDIAASSAEKKREERKLIESRYFDSLPKEIVGLTRGRRGWELEDDYGNYMITLPAQAAHEGWALKKLEEWINSQAADGFGE